MGHFGQTSPIPESEKNAVSVLLAYEEKKMRKKILQASLWKLSSTNGPEQDVDEC